MEGILLVDKPSGWTSFDVVNYIRKLVAAAEAKPAKTVKVGHSGTLDPFATGLLVLLIGKDWTKRAGEFSKLEKGYLATMTLGAKSSTGDLEGEIAKVSDNKPTRRQLEDVLTHYHGEIEQVPPAFSAIKVGGRRAYKLARAGQAPVLEPRKVEVRKLKLLRLAYPEADIETEVSSGTYVRSLVEDIGNELGTGAYTSALRRTFIGDFRVSEAKPVKDFDAATVEQFLIKP